MFLCPCLSLCFYKIIVNNKDLMEFSYRISISTLAKTSVIWFPIMTIFLDNNIMKALTCQKKNTVQKESGETKNGKRNMIEIDEIKFGDTVQE